MNLTRGFLLALGFAPLAQRACALATDGGGLRGGSPSARRDMLTRLAQEGVSDVGMRNVHPIGLDEAQVGQDLIASLEANTHISGETSRRRCSA